MVRRVRGKGSQISRGTNHQHRPCHCTEMTTTLPFDPHSLNDPLIKNSMTRQPQEKLIWPPIGDKHASDTLQPTTHPSDVSWASVPSCSNQSVCTVSSSLSSTRDLSVRNATAATVSPTTRKPTWSAIHQDSTSDPSLESALANTSHAERKRKISCDDLEHDLEHTSSLSGYHNKLQQNRLLALPEDGRVLSPLHAFVRQQIEVFSATEVELSEPAPGRKHPIQQYQLGLRCIHCKHEAQRAKRAVCYPTQIGRIYNSVSDMKCDHFPHCQHLPRDVKERFRELRDQHRQHKRVACTAQYYYEAAVKMGMVNGTGGVFWASSRPPTLLRQDDSPVPAKRARQITHALTQNNSIRRALDSARALSIVPMRRNEDRNVLNPLHCFVRRNIEYFAATQEDVQAPAPGRKVPVRLGQVGIRCVHCKHLTKRKKRAVCYPPSVSGIYHCVSNMKFDHFGHCTALPEEECREFTILREEHSRKGPSKKETKSKQTTNTTAQYYLDSAKALGLVDCEDGIRFANGGTFMRGEPALDGMTVLMMALSTQVPMVNSIVEAV